MGSRRAKLKRGFGEISRLPSGRYRARYTGPDTNRHSAPLTFVARIDAEGWLVDQERPISRGEWRPPAGQVRAAPLLLGEYAAAVVGRRRLRPATVALYAKLLRLTILPKWADRPIRDITTAEISAWYAGMRKTPTQQANAYGLLKSIFKEAVDEGLLEANPCRVKAGGQKQRARETDVLTVDQLNRYVAAVPEARRAPLLLAGWCGLRSGEVRGLRVRDLDLDAGVVHVRQAVVRLKGQLLIGPPKTNAGIRAVAIPPHLLPALRLWAARQPTTRSRDALLFPAGDGHSPLNDSVLRGRPTTRARRPSICQGSRSTAYVTPAPPWPRSSERPSRSSKRASGTAPPTWRCVINTSPPNAMPNSLPACQHSQRGKQPLLNGCEGRTGATSRGSRAPGSNLL